MSSMLPAFIQSGMFYLTPCFYRYLMDGAESSSESEMEVDDKSVEEINTKVVYLFVFLRHSFSFATSLNAVFTIMPAATTEAGEKSVP